MRHREEAVLAGATFLSLQATHSLWAFLRVDRIFWHLFLKDSSEGGVRSES